MDDDIDIEEHDVMDDPRVRQMFPDLIRVKTEVIEQDEIEEDPEEHCYDYDPNVCLKQEVYQDYYNGYELSNEEATVHKFSNKIILGSKPSTNEIEEEISIGKEYLPAEVLLEDWGDRLRNSPCFCVKCKTLFATESALDYHKMEAHSFLVAISNKAVKSTAKNNMNSTQLDNESDEEYIVPDQSEQRTKEKNKLCNHCHKYFPDGTALIKHLYELLTKDEANNEAKVKQSGTGDSKLAVVTKSTSYQCGLCHTMFLGYPGVKIHMAGVHPGVHADDYIVKVFVDNKKVKSEPKVMFDSEMRSKGFVEVSADIHYQYNQQMFITNPPIPRSVLHKCVTCEIHFVMGLPALHHSRQCGNTRPYSICDLCGKKIRLNDVILHKQQHKVATSKDFRIYESNSKNYKNYLCKCPKCGVCFNEMRFLKHFKECQFIRFDCEICTVCKEYIDGNNAQAHKNAHRFQKLVKSQFIIVQFLQLSVGFIKPPQKIIKKEIDIDVEQKPINLFEFNKDTVYKTYKRKIDFDSKVKKPMKRKIESDSDVVDKKIKLKGTKRSKFELSYCKLCNCSFHTNKWQIHLGSNCRRVPSEICQECGIVCTPKSLITHSRVHKSKHVTLEDFKFYLRDGSQTVPKVPDFFACPKCKVRYSTKKLRKIHDCSSVYETCHICAKKFSPLAHKLHVPFHFYGKNHLKPQTDSVKKYNLLDKMWNILFYCRYCDQHTDSYDEAVRHSHNHLTLALPLKENSLCEVCNLNFDEQSYERHTSLHAELPINQSDFLILRYDYKTVLTSNWLRLFGKLALNKVEQILSRSIFKDTRKVSFKIVKEGQPEHTLQVCKKCNLCVTRNSAPMHCLIGCQPFDEDLHCLLCNITFDKEDRYKKHQKIHSKINNQFRIVYFEALDLKSESWGRKSALTKSGSDYIFYKCRKCGISIADVNHLHTHKCMRTANQVCNKCGIKYRLKCRQRHEKYHLKYPNLSKRNVRFQMFSLKNNKTMFWPTCRCGQGFTTDKELARHTEFCPKVTKTPAHTEKLQKSPKHAGVSKKILPKNILKMHITSCKRCGSFFKAELEKKKYCIICDGKEIESGDSAKKSNVQVLYQCSKCSCHYTSRKGWRIHTKTCEIVSHMRVMKCSICNLKFRCRSIDIHMQRNHTKKSYLFQILEPESGKSRIVAS